jgi:hypothetical protein
MRREGLVDQIGARRVVPCVADAVALHGAGVS